MVEQTKVIIRLDFSIATILFGCFMFSMGWFLCDLAPTIRMLVDEFLWAPYPPSYPPAC